MNKEEVRAGDIAYPKFSVAKGIDADWVRIAYEITSPALTDQCEVRVERAVFVSEGWQTLGSGISVPLDELLTKDQFNAACEAAPDPLF